MAELTAVQQASLDAIQSLIDKGKKIDIDILCDALDAPNVPAARMRLQVLRNLGVVRWEPRDVSTIAVVGARPQSTVRRKKQRPTDKATKLAKTRTPSRRATPAPTAAIEQVVEAAPVPPTGAARVIIATEDELAELLQAFRVLGSFADRIDRARTFPDVLRDLAVGLEESVRGLAQKLPPPMAPSAIAAPSTSPALPSGPTRRARRAPRKRTVAASETSETPSETPDDVDDDPEPPASETETVETETDVDDIDEVDENETVETSPAGETTPFHFAVMSPLSDRPLARSATLDEAKRALQHDPTADRIVRLADGVVVFQRERGRKVG